MIRTKRTKDESLASKTHQKVSGMDHYIQSRLQLLFKDKPELMNHPDYHRQLAEEWKNLPQQHRLPYDNMVVQNSNQHSVDVKPKRSAKADSSTSGGATSSGKRKRAPKDPLAPKRNLSAFFHFSSAERSNVKAGMPSATVGELAKELGKRWAVLPVDQKAAFQKIAVEDKQRYVVEKAAYENRGKTINIPVDLSGGKRGSAAAAPTAELGPSDEETDSD